MRAVELALRVVAKEQAGMGAKEQAGLGTHGAADGFKLDAVGLPKLLSTGAISGCSSSVVGRPGGCAAGGAGDGVQVGLVAVMVCAAATARLCAGTATPG